MTSSTVRLKTVGEVSRSSETKNKQPVTISTKARWLAGNRCGRCPHAPDPTNGAVASDVGQQVEIFVVFVLATFSFAKHLFRLDELNTLDPFDHLVAKLILHSQPQGRSK